MKKQIFFFLLLFLVCDAVALALPDAARHSYVNCSTCHFSPGGGGALNAYGRALSQEIYGTFKLSEKSFFGALPDSVQKLNEEDKLIVAGFVRGLQYHEKNPATIEASFIPMQADLELGYNSANFAIIGTVGQQSIDTSNKRLSHTFSRRHYLLYRLDEKNQVRGGRFMRPYGLQDPDHTLYVRKDLGFDFDTETYNMEYAFQLEDANLLLNYSFGNFDNHFARTQEKGLTLSGSHALGEKTKIGVSAFAGRTAAISRVVAGPWAIVSYTESLFSSVEADFQTSHLRATTLTADGPNTRSYAFSHKLNYEVIKGIIPYLLTQQAKADTNQNLTLKRAIGLGTEWFVAPHIELAAQMQREFLYTLNKPKVDEMFVMGHLYF